jgi:superfamily II DNA helicase RecQ
MVSAVVFSTYIYMYSDNYFKELNFLFYNLGIKRGDMSVILASPEAMEKGQWLEIMREYAERICLLAFDEVHCLSEWLVFFVESFIRLCVSLNK